MSTASALCRLEELVKIARITLILFGLILVVFAFWSVKTPDEETLKTVPNVQQTPSWTELHRTPTEPLASSSINGAVWMPKSCTHPVMEIMIKDGTARMGSNC
ncbi:hypothetical protein HQ487_03745 [Candidatus Uhrbacteria bacterium]|nr:hypothetical protein [Candidatus Uhrbacteria bacterium]